MTKKVMTVQGKISAEEVGITLPHEHLLVDARNWMHSAPRELSLSDLVKKPVSIDNRGEVIYRNFYFEDNLLQTDINVAIDEARKFKESGGSTIIDLTLPGIGRDPEALYRISVATGLNIIMAAGNYVASSWSEEDKKKSEEQIAKDIIDDFTIGVGNMGIKAGIIGEVGISDIKNKIEIKNLHASALAQKELGCGINIHCPIWEKDGNKILDVLEEAGANLDKVALSHCDPTLDDADYHDSLAKRGAYIEYDQFGMELMTYEEKFLPSDRDRIKAILEQIRRGNIEYILISHDICFKILLTKWGGWGFAHIGKHIIPRMKQFGITNEQIYKMTVENPKRLLSF